MKSKSVLFEGGVEKISTLADGSLRVHIGTPELSDETMVNLFKMNRKTGYVLLSPYPVNKDQQEAVEKAVEGFDFSNTDNYEVEFGIDYDGKVHLENVDLQAAYELTENIVDKVCNLFKEAECPETDECESTVTKAN